MSAYTLPDGPPLDQNGNLKPAFAQWFTRTHNSTVTLQDSGVTGDRPTSLLWIGRFYFDTTLTKPIWIKSVNASGVATWCDATGTTA